MAFVIPDWEDGNPDYTGNHVKLKTKKSGKSNQGVTENSKIINKLKKKQLIEKNITTKGAVQLIKEKNNAPEIKNTLTKAKYNLQKTNKINFEKPKGKKQEKHPKDNNSSGSMRVDNIDTDKLDEVLLNAKKKKFNEAMKRDDVEDLLFREDKSPEVVKTKKPLAQQKNINNLSSNVNNKSSKLHKIGKAKNDKFKAVNGQIENTRQKEIVKRQKEIVTRMPTQEVHRDRKKEKIKLVIQKQSNRNPINVDKNKLRERMLDKLKAVNGQTESTRQNEIVEITPSKKVLQDRKKEKIKLMIQEQSNRNTINFDRSKLRERMLDRLKSAQFRFINEKLYTSSGTEASQLFQNDPAAFQSYHEGYRQQVKKWPVNPLDVIIKRIKKMPKSHLIADMGCGEAELARRVPQSVRSFDLQQANDQVEVCDMAHTPLLSESMDAVVYCLALMGTDLTAYLLEANRVLKTGGHLLIAEVESRFADIDAFTKDVTRLGFKLAKLNRDHEVFFFLEFVKNQAPPVKKSKLPALTLKPCIYKRR